MQLDALPQLQCKYVVGRFWGAGVNTVIWAAVLGSALVAGWRGWRRGTQSFQQPWDVAQPTIMGRREYQRWVRAARKRRRLMSTVLFALAGAAGAFAFLFLISL